MLRLINNRRSQKLNTPRALGTKRLEIYIFNLRQTACPEPASALRAPSFPDYCYYRVLQTTNPYKAMKISKTLKSSKRAEINNFHFPSSQKVTDDYPT